MGLAHSHHHPPDAAQLQAGEKGIWALKLSLLGLSATAIFQAVIVYFSGSAALLADTLHNVVDALSSIPLWIAFVLARRKPTDRLTYGYSRLEDIAGLLIVALIVATAFVVGYESYQKLAEGHVPQHLPWVIAGALIGYAGNEAVAQLRIRVGKQIGSAALVADGHHARSDAFTSLGVLVGTVGVYAGYPWVDPVVGMVFAVFILKIGWNSAKDIFSRLADVVEPGLVDSIREAARNVDGVMSVLDIRARYVGHSLRVEVTIEVNGELSVAAGHDIAIEVQRKLQHAFPLLVSPTIHVDPSGHQGEEHHFMEHHANH
jgi:cation diffusion facilitator family transporter